MAIDSKKLADWYDFQASFYHLWRGSYRGALVREVFSRTDDFEGEVCLLDAGCGSGLFCVPAAAEHASWMVVGMDLSGGMINIAKKQAGKLALANLGFVHATVEEIPVADGVFDLIFAGGLFPNLVDRSAALNEFYRVLKPHGRLLVLEFDRASMTLFTRLFFRLMILGYRGFSRVVEKFRFSDNWDIASSTTCPSELRQLATSGGFRFAAEERFESHVLLTFLKENS